MDALLAKPGLQALLVSGRQEGVAPSELLLLTERSLDQQHQPGGCCTCRVLLGAVQEESVTLRSYPMLKAEPLGLCPVWPRLVGPLPGPAA